MLRPRDAAIVSRWSISVRVRPGGQIVAAVAIEP